MKHEYSVRITSAINALEDVECLEGVSAGQHSLGDDESGLPFENGFDMAMDYVREASLAKYGSTPPAIYAADHDGEHARFFFFGQSTEDVLAKIEAAKAEHDAKPFLTSSPRGSTRSPAHPVEGDTMETTVKKHEGPEGQVAYDVTITHQGIPFTAGGGSLDPVAGVAVGYPIARKSPLPGEAKHFLGIGGGEIYAMDLRLVREYSVRPPGAWHSVRIYCWSGVHGGRRYHGRNSGVGMLLRMRAR